MVVTMLQKAKAGRRPVAITVYVHGEIWYTYFVLNPRKLAMHLSALLVAHIQIQTGCF